MPFRGPLPIIGPEVANQVRQLVNPSGHMDLALLQDMRIVLPVQAPPTPMYEGRGRSTATAGQNSVLSFSGQDNAGFFLDWVEFFEPGAGPLQVSVRAGATPAAFPVFTNLTTLSFRSVDDPRAQLPGGFLTGFGEFAFAGLGGVTLQQFWQPDVMPAAGEGWPLHRQYLGLYVPAGVTVFLACTTANLAVSWNARIGLVR